MNSSDLIQECRRSGVTLAADEDGGLTYRGDRAAINRLLPTIKAHKPDLLRILTAQATEVSPDDVHTDCDPERLYPGNGRQHPLCDSRFQAHRGLARNDQTAQAGPAPASATEPTSVRRRTVSNNPQTPPALTGANQGEHRGKTNPGSFLQADLKHLANVRLSSPLSANQAEHWAKGPTSANLDLETDPLAYWTARGWRACFGPPGPDGKQLITWHAPGTFEPWTPEGKP